MDTKLINAHTNSVVQALRSIREIQGRLDQMSYHGAKDWSDASEAALLAAQLNEIADRVMRRGEYANR